ncbi:hypothetical protein ACVWZR_009829 [Bradyrhizobium sp. i1.3.1]
MGSRISDVTFAAFGDLARDAKRPEAAPGRRRARRRAEPGVSRRRILALLLEQRLEGMTPAAAQRRNFQRALQAVARVRRQIEQRIDLGHAHAFGAISDLRDLVAGLDVAFLDHTKIEAGPAVPDKQRGHVRLLHANPQPVTGDARLRHLEQGRADFVTVSDADVPVGEAVDGKILAELTLDEVRSTEVLLPVLIGLPLVDVDGALLAAMTGGIALSIAVDVEPAHPARTTDGRLPDAGINGLALPRDVARQADIEGEQTGHGVPRRDGAALAVSRSLQCQSASMSEFWPVSRC